MIEKIQEAKKEIAKIYVGGERLIDHILICFFAGSHIIIEGKPGFGKTLLARAFASIIDAGFKKVQFTSDRRPQDLLGYELPIWTGGGASTDELKDNIRERLISLVRKGPVFTNILVIDEVNRSPEEAQNALLSAMEEGEVTIGEITYRLDDLFMVLATLNPAERAGIHRLGVAFSERFMLSSPIERPSVKEYKSIAVGTEIIDKLSKVFSPADVVSVRSQIKNNKELLPKDSPILDYMTRLWMALSPDVSPYSDIRTNVEKISSDGPRTLKYLVRASYVYSLLLKGKSFISPQDVAEVFPFVVRHLIALKHKAVSQGITVEDLIEKAISRVSIV